MHVCSTGIFYHYLLNPSEELIDSILQVGLRPLSDFPESERWRTINRQLPDFFENLYHEWFESHLGMPYVNSGVFLTPIDFRRLRGSMLHESPRVTVPIGRLQAECCCLTYEHKGERIVLPVVKTHLKKVQQLWTADLVTRWFGVDKNRLFYYVPQVACFQDGGIPVTEKDIER